MTRVNAKELYLDKKDVFGGWYDYQPMLDAFGTIAIQVDDYNYQGDSRLLYDNDGKIGFLIFGWGSCSGCDALKACNTIEEIQALCDKLQDDIRWFDNRKEALEWFSTHDWEGDYSWYAEETKRFVRKCIEYLKEEDK